MNIQVLKKYHIFLIVLIFISILCLSSCQSSGVTIYFHEEEGVNFRPITLKPNAESVTLPQPQKIGYTFIGWFSDEERSILFDSSVIPAENVTLYAGWEIGEILVTFRAKLAHENSYDFQYLSVPYGHSIATLIPDVPAKNGYIGQWNLEGISTTSVQSAYVIDAIYTPKLFNITLIIDNDSSPIIIEEYMNQPYTIPPNPTKENYFFGGWFTDKKYSTPFIFPSLMPDYNITAYAWWINESELASTLIYERADYQGGSNNAIRITGLSRVGQFLSNILIPNEIDNLPVKFIGYDIPYEEALASTTNYAVFQTSYLTTLLIDDSVEMIGTNAFSQSSRLSTVNFTENSQLTKIADSAFYNCTTLQNIIIPTTVEYIGKYAFATDTTMQITHITIPDESSLTFIGDFAFQNTDNLNSFTIPKGMTNISHTAFEKSGIRQFQLENGHPSFSVTNGVLFSFDNEKLILFPPRGGVEIATTSNDNILFEYYVPSITKFIGERAFQGNSHLAHLHIPDRVQEIGDYAFFDTPNLQQVTFNDIALSSLDSLGLKAFSGAISLTTLQLPSRLSTIKQSTFSAIDENHPMQLQHITLPTSLQIIEQYAFQNCQSLTAVDMPISLQNIEQYAFYNCFALTFSFPDSLSNSLTTIGDFAFYNCYNITTLTLPYSLLSIGEYAFSASPNINNALKLRTINSTPQNRSFQIESIGKGAFAQCVSLQQFTLNESLSFLGEQAFYNCKSLNIALSDNSSLTEILPYTFYNCISLTGINIPTSVTAIGDYAFFQCVKLTTIISGTTTEESKISTIGESAFEGCIRLDIKEENSFTFLPFPNTVSIGKRAFFDCKALSKIVLNTVEELGEQAFARCHQLEDISFDNNTSLTTLNKNVFQDCVNLSFFALPNSIINLVGNPFSGCTSLTHFYVNNDNPNYKVISEPNNNYSTLYSKSGRSLVLFPSGIETVFIVPQEVTDIAPYAFYKSQVTKVTFASFDPVPITIGEYAFSDCQKLTEIVLHKNISEIGNFAFYNCSSLTICTIEEVTNSPPLEIGEYAFWGTAIESLTIPERTTQIGKYAFAQNYNLYELIFRQIADVSEHNLILDDYAFRECVALREIVLPKRLLKINDAVFAWCVNLQNISFSTNTQPLTLGSFVFDNCHLIKSITLPPNLTQMGNNVFNYCLSLEQAIITENTSSTGLTLGNYAFLGCNELQTFTIPSQVSKIGDYAFFGCGNLNNIAFSASNNDLTIGDFAFAQCSALTRFVIPSRIIHIGDFAFFESGLGSPLLKVTLGNEIVGAYTDALIFDASNKDLTIGQGSFQSTALSVVEIPTRVISVGQDAFRNNPNLVSVTFVTGSRCQNIEESAFENIGYEPILDTNTNANTSFEYDKYLPFDNIYRIELGDSLISLGKNAFRNATTIRSILLNDGLQTISEQAFWGCTSLIAIDIPTSVTLIGNSAFFGCISLNTVQILSPNYYELGDYAFAECSELTSLSLKMVGVIGFAPAYNCNKLATLSIDNSNPYYKIINNVLYTKNVTHGNTTYSEDELLILYPAGKIGSSYTIPERTREIGPFAFSGNNNLSSITINNGNNVIISIFDNTFNSTSLALEFFLNSSLISQYLQDNLWKNHAKHIKRMDEIKNDYTIEVMPGDPSSCRIIKYVGQEESGSEITIPKSIHSLTVKEIGSNAFSYNTVITKIIIQQGILKIGDYAFYNCSSLTTIHISDSVQSIGEYAFSNCWSLTSIDIGENSLLSTISDYAFQKCISLVDIYLPKRLTNIGMFAFAGDSNHFMQLNNICFADNINLEEIQSRAFQYNNTLSSIVLPISVKMLGSNLFYNCNSLLDIHILRGVNQSLTQMKNKDTFAGTPEELMIYVPQSALRNYLQTQYWKLIDAQISTLESLEGDFSIENIEHTYKSAQVIEYLGIFNAQSNKYDTSFEAEFNDLELLNNLPKVTINYANRTFSQIINNTEVINNYIRVSEATEIQTIIVYDKDGQPHTVKIKNVDFRIEGIRLLKYTGNEVSILLPTHLRNKPILEIGKYCFSHKVQQVTIPEGVLSINANAFQNCTQLIKVILPLSLTTISENAFRNASIQEVEFNSLNSSSTSRLSQVSDFAFYNCISLLEIKLPMACSVIGNYAFSSDLTKGRMKINNVSLQGFFMEYIGINAFANSNIVSLSLPKALGVIKNGAFKNCIYLSALYIYDNSQTSPIIRLEGTTSDIFEGCYFIKLYVSDNKFDYYKNNSLWSNFAFSNKLYKYEFIYGDFAINILDTGNKQAELAQYLGNNANLTIPTQINGYTIVSILPYAFTKTTKIVTIPTSIQHIRNEAFARSGIEEVYFAIGATISTIGSSAFRYSSIRSISIPLSLTNIGEYAFSDTQLASINFDFIDILDSGNQQTVDSLKIARYAFNNIHTLTSLQLPKRLEEIAEFAFYENINLTNIELHQSGILKEIKSYAFAHCYSLKQISIPSSVEAMGESVFSNCHNLTALYMQRSNVPSLNIYPTTIGIGLLNNIKNPFLKVYVPSDSINIYRETENWKEYSGYDSGGQKDLLNSSDYIIPNTIIGDFAYELMANNNIRLTQYRGNNTNLTIPNELIINQEPYNVARIGRFFGNNNIKSINMLLGHNQTIELYAFSECRSLVEIYLPDSVESFWDTNSTDIYSYAFKNCINLQKVRLPSNIAVLPEGMFAGCSSLKEIQLPATVTNIHSSAFLNCSSLSRIYLHSEITGENNMFFHCSEYLKIFVPDHLVATYKNAQHWRQYSSYIISINALYGKYAIQTIQNEDTQTVRIVQFVGTIQQLYIPEYICGKKVMHLALNAISDNVEEIFLPIDSDISFEEDIQYKIVYY